LKHEGNTGLHVTTRFKGDDIDLRMGLNSGWWIMMKGDGLREASSVREPEYLKREHI